MRSSERCRAGPPSGVRATTRRRGTSTTTSSCRPESLTYASRPSGHTAVYRGSPNAPATALTSSVRESTTLSRPSSVCATTASPPAALSMLRGPAGVSSRRSTRPVARWSTTMLDSRSAVTSASGVPPARRPNAGAGQTEHERCRSRGEEVAPVHARTTHARPVQVRDLSGPLRCTGGDTRRGGRNMLRLAALLLVPLASPPASPRPVEGRRRA